MSEFIAHPKTTAECLQNCELALAQAKRELAEGNKYTALQKASMVSVCGEQFFAVARAEFLGIEPKGGGK